MSNNKQAKSGQVKNAAVENPNYPIDYDFPNSSTTKEIKNNQESINTLEELFIMPTFSYDKVSNETVKSKFNNNTSYSGLPTQSGSLRVTQSKMIGCRLLQVRSLLGLNRIELAKQLNNSIKPSALARFELGKVFPSRMKLEYIAVTLSAKYNINLTLNWLLSGEGKVPEYNTELVKHNKAIIKKVMDKNTPEKLLNALQIFLQISENIYSNSFFASVNDNRMNPLLKKGSIVGGYAVPKKLWGQLSQSKVIITLFNGEQFCRLIEPVSNAADQFIVSCIDPTYKPKIIQANRIERITAICYSFFDLDQFNTKKEKKNKNNTDTYTSASTSAQTAASSFLQSAQEIPHQSEQTAV